MPPTIKVSDPATQIVASDKTTQADPTTGTPVTVTSNTYTTTPGSTSSGQKTGDSGPAAASSAGSSDDGSYGGGGDCNTPPACSGDAVMCGASRTQWATTCQLHKDVAGTGAPSDLDALKTMYSQSDVWSDADTSQDGTVGGQANAGIYDQSGFGFGNTCPLKDISVSLGKSGQLVIPLADKCFIGPWLRGLVIGFALFAAAMITAGGKGTI